MTEVDLVRPTPESILDELLGGRTMPGEYEPRMYGVTCPNSTAGSFHTVRLGEVVLTADATTAKLLHHLVENNELPGFSLCQVCNVDIPIVLDHVRFVDDSEEPSEHATVHF